MGTQLSSRYGQKPVDSAKKWTTDAIKTVSKRAIQKTAEATGDLSGNKIADKIADKFTSGSEKSKKPQNNDADDESERPKKRYISPEKIEQIIDELRLV